ncbi:hypothetical protein PsorP6_011062 [Peronosclerospora sorghi]|uniref:Uncharacterized protein n=1 Tax=Peronosclerospora sorghi TaxID=230839 RepID=A0ACC0VU91_9STRA|nr:hypothetical protein PsorP6_011062 [Peronosclerospora sorghi]
MEEKIHARIKVMEELESTAKAISNTFGDPMLEFDLLLDQLDTKPSAIQPLQASAVQAGQIGAVGSMGVAGAMVGQASLQNADMSSVAGDNDKIEGEAVSGDALRQEQLAQDGRDLFGEEELFSATLDLETISGASNTSQPHKQSVSAKFCDQMHEVTDMLNATRCNYIRCIKPNPTMSPGIFDHGYVVDQLCCSGVLATCELLNVGLPTRVEYEKICLIYKTVLPPSVAPMFDAYNDRTFTESGLCLFRVELDAYRLGRTKVFFKTGNIALLDALLNVHMKKMGPWIVARLRKWLARGRLRYYLAKVLVQRTFLRILEDTRRRKAAIVKMQAMMRMFAIRK